MTAAPTTAAGLARFEDRGACTDAERRAAGWLHDQLRAAGHEAWVETHWVRPQWALSLALHATAGIVASVLALTAPLAAAIVAAVAALSLALEAGGRSGPLRWLLPRRATQNVLTVPDEEGAPDVTLLICARYDAPRGGLVTRDGPRRLAARLRRRLGGRVPGPRTWVALALLAVAVCAGLRALGLEGLWLGLAQFVPTLALLGALAAAGDIAVSPVSPGAGDNAAGVGVAVALHAELTRNPPAALAPALLLYGAGDGGASAVRAHLRRERLDRTRVVVLELGPCGAGAPAYATAHPQLRAACERGRRRARGRRCAARARPPRPAGAGSRRPGSARSTPTASPRARARAPTRSSTSIPPPRRPRSTSRSPASTRSTRR